MTGNPSGSIPSPSNLRLYRAHKQHCDRLLRGRGIARTVQLCFLDLPPGAGRMPAEGDMRGPSAGAPHPFTSPLPKETCAVKQYRVNEV